MRKCSKHQIAMMLQCETAWRALALPVGWFIEGDSALLQSLSAPSWSC